VLINLGKPVKIVIEAFVWLYFLVFEIPIDEFFNE